MYSIFQYSQFISICGIHRSASQHIPRPRTKQTMWPLTSTWHPPDIHWHPPDIHLTSTWHPPDIHLTSTWHLPDIHLTSTWHPPDIHLIIWHLASCAAMPSPNGSLSPKGRGRHGQGTEGTGRGDAAISPGDLRDDFRRRDRIGITGSPTGSHRPCGPHQCTAWISRFNIFSLTYDRDLTFLHFKLISVGIPSLVRQWSQPGGSHRTIERSELEPNEWQARTPSSV